MAKCRRCSASVPGRRQVCDSCKASKGRGSRADRIVVDEVQQVFPPGLHRRGRELWSALEQKTGTPAGELALELCRQADRLDELDRIIAGKGVLQLMKFRLEDNVFDAEGDQHIHVKVGFQSVLSEARMQQIAFKDLGKELRMMLAAGTSAAKGSAPAATSTTTAPPTGLDQLASRRAAREQAST